MLDSLFPDDAMRRTKLWVLLIVAIWGVVMLLASAATYPIDFSSVYVASALYRDGAVGLIYPASEAFFWETPPALWKDYADAAATEFGTTAEHYPPYIYPPLWAAVFAPLTGLVEFRVAASLNLVLNVVAGGAIMLMGAALLRPNSKNMLRWVIVAAAISGTSLMAHLAYDLGQVQTLVSALVLLSVLKLMRGQDAQAGGWMALAAAVKLSPALFVVIFVIERRWRALASFAVVGGGLALASVLVAGWPLHAAFLDKLQHIGTSIQLTRIHVGLDQALFYGGQLMSDGIDWNLLLPADALKPAWIDWSVRSVLIAGLVLTWWVTRNLDIGPRLWGQLMLLQILSVLVSPLGWVQNLLLPLLLLPGMIELRPTRAIWACVALIAAGFSTGCFILIYGSFTPIPLHSLFYVSLTAGMLVVVAIVLAGLRNPRLAP